jgi:hypothetical protein
MIDVWLEILFLLPIEVRTCFFLVLPKYRWFSNCVYELNCYFSSKIHTWNKNAENEEKASCKEKKDACKVAKVFFSQERSPYTKSFSLRMMKNHQHSTKKATHTQEKSQGTVISAEDANIIIRGLKLCGVPCKRFMWSGEEPKVARFLSSNLLLAHYS